MSVPLAGRGVGLNAIVLEVLEDGAPLYRAGMEQPLSPLDDASFGRRLPSGGPVALWWCEGAYKVSRTRPAPRESGDAVRLEAARNEYEPAQIVIRPDRDLRNVRVRVGHLSRSGEPQTRLPADNIAVSLVGYVNVTRPTDAGGARGYWPDPLPPFAQGTDLPAGRNHPLWLTVHVPPDQPAGRYEGEIILEAEGWRAAVPVEVKVWDFALPREPRLQTAFGLSHHLIRRYHNLETTEELRAVLDLYHRDCAAHRIAPYDPAPLDPIRVEFNAGGWTAGDYDASTAHAGQRSLRVTDDSPTSSIAASSEDLIPLDTAVDHHLSWWVKTQDEGQPYLVTLAQHDEAGQWIWGNNVDVPCVGSGRWEQVEALVPPERFNERTRFVGIALRPAPWSEEGEATGTAWFDDVRLAAEGRQENLVRSGDFELGTASLEAEVDFTAFDRQCERCLDELGFNTLMVGLRGMPGGTFYARRPGRAGPFEQGSAEYERLMASQGRQIVEHLRGKGWLGKAYCYWFDEPEPRDYAFVVEGMELLQRAAPGLTRMLTEQPEDELAGHVDLWCPVVGAVSREAIAERKRHGERLWWYLCTAPKTPYIGLFIDRPAVDLRAWAWLSRKWGIEGLLVWSANYWTSPTAFPGPEVQNPWDDPMSYVTGYGRERGQIGYWGNGDGRFLYPPNRDVNNDAGKHLSGPVSSLRWEMLREGVEDYDYFHLLAELARRAEGAGAPAGLLARARALAVVPDAVITDGRTYSNDPASLYAHRHRMAEVIEELSRTLRGEP
ncbi:MAG: hypothetical protein AMK73_05215 [Planctomycetes bacterium SM23_32]|nr:MAG: hypothetical protein AMK73_05215 [Planctomycetes bacterium SM23_32]